MTTTAQPRSVQRRDELDIPSLASAISSVHASLVRHGGAGMAMGPGGAALGAAARRVAPRIERSVAEAVQPHVSPPRSLRPNPARVLAARATVATLNGMSAGIAAGRRRVAEAMRPSDAPVARAERREPTFEPARPAADAPRQAPPPSLARNLREVLPAMAADAARADLSRLGFTVRDAAAEAGRRAGDLARMAFGKARFDLSRLSGTLPDAKFARNATVLPAGNATPEGTGRVLRALAVAALVGAVSFNVVAEAKAQGGYRAQVSGQVEAPSIDDLFKKSFGGASQIRAPGAPAAQAAPAPVATAAPTRTTPTVVPPAELRQAAAPVLAAPLGEVSYRGVATAPSRAFLDLAESTIGIATGDYKGAKDRLASGVGLGVDCLRGLTRDTECVVLVDGVRMDFRGGTHSIILKPVPGVTTADRQLATERGGVLTVTDTEAMAIVEREARGAALAEAGTSFGYEGDEAVEDAPEASGAPRP